MSHFTVAVILSNLSNLPEALKAALQPFHEFECTGEVDQYVESVNIVDEVRDDYERDTITRVTLPDGRQVPEHSNELYRPATLEEKTKVGHSLGGFGVAEGIVFKTIDGELRVYDLTGLKSETHPVRDCMTLTEYATDQYSSKDTLGPDEEPDLENTHKWGWIRVNGDGIVTEIIRRTNPNKKWDWWVVGGRWPNMLLDKSGERGDVCRRGDLDLDTMREQARVKADAEYTKIEDVFRGLAWPPKPWAEFRADFANIDDARVAYNGYPAMKKHAELDHKHPLKLWMDDPSAEYNRTREQYVSAEVGRVGVPFAVLKDGTWYEKGQMGWFGFVADEKDQAAWNREYQTLLDSLNADDVIVMVDCHI